MVDLRDRYGEWAVIAGGSEGIGAAIGHAYAAAGVNLVLLARRPELLEEAAARIRSIHGVEVRTVAVDLGAEHMWTVVESALDDLDVGMLVYNAAYGGAGPFLDRKLEDHYAVLAVNARAPVTLSWHLGRRMRERGRGSIVLVSSTGGMAGQVERAMYSSTKAFQWILGEALWGELRDNGIDVLAYMVGVTLTPKLVEALPQFADADFVANLPQDTVKTPEEIATRLVQLLDGGPQVFDRDRAGERAGDGRSRAELVLATADLRPTAVELQR